jgi:quinol monooxygenase YgiN
MIAIVATLRVQDGKGPDLETLFRDLGGKVRANEPGNVLYQLAKSRTEANTYKVLELYKDEAALEAHRGSAHFKAAGPTFATILAGRPDIEYLDAIV